MDGYVVRAAVARLPMTVVRRALRIAVRVGEDEAMASLVWHLPDRRLRAALYSEAVREEVIEALSYRVSPPVHSGATCTTTPWSTDVVTLAPF